MFKRIQNRGSWKWYDILDELIEEYNNDYHRTIKMKPVEVNSTSIEKYLLNTVYNFREKDELWRAKHKPKYKVGDVVRISQYRSLFARSFHVQWSYELYKISHVNNHVPTTYNLRDLTNQDIKGVFYEPELQKTTNEDIYLIDKVIKRKGNKCLVSYLGFKGNYWIDKSQLL